MKTNSILLSEDVEKAFSFIQNSSQEEFDKEYAIFNKKMEEKLQQLYFGKAQIRYFLNLEKYRTVIELEAVRCGKLKDITIYGEEK